MSLLLLTILLGAAGALPVFAQEVHRFDVASSDASAAIQEFGMQSGVQILAAGDGVRGKRLNPVTGDFSTEQGLQLLLAGSGLTHRYVSERAVALVAQEGVGAPPVGEARSKGTGSDVREDSPAGPSVERSATPDAAGKPEPTTGAERISQKRIELEEVIVTGTHISGGSPSPSPSSVYTRDDIIRSGFGSIQDFAQRIPQNFANISENSPGGIAGGREDSNSMGASAFNLRGLGDGATLTLIDGHRVAAGGNSGMTVDLSMIPLSAIDRMEVVVDGASAIYGSDAVGGVVNFILRKDFDGAESGVRYGSVTSGSSDQLQVSQALGTTWSKGALLAAAQYSKQNPLDAADRSFSVDAAGTKLAPSHEVSNLFLTGHGDIAETVEFFGNANLAHRDSYFDFDVGPSFQQRYSVDLDNYGGLAGLRYRATPDMAFEVSTSYGESSANTQTDSDGSVFRSRFNTRVLAVDASLSGNLFDTRAGAIEYAFGGQYRTESFSRSNLNSGALFDPSRNLWAAFGEVRIPLVESSSGDASRTRLEVSVAGRHEDYSDFGSTDNPKFGMIWRPIAGMSLRGTYGTSFTAPKLSDLNPVLDQALPLPEFDAVSGTTVNTLVIFGGNADLKPETSTSWTVGADFAPTAFAGFKASVTYYDIDFRGRINTPQFAVGFFDLLRSDDILGPVVQRNPPAALIQQYTNGPWLANFFDIDLSTIGALVDFRQQNLSRLKTSGFDVNMTYAVPVSFGDVHFALDGNWATQFNTRLTPTSSETEVLDTVYNPIALRVRAQGGLSWGENSANLFVNYCGAYRDIRVASLGPVASWTTVDLTFSHRVSSQLSPLSGIDVTLSLLNVADKDPPFVANPDNPLFFDGTNANPLGRYVSLAVQKRW